MSYDNCNVVIDWDGNGNKIYDLMANWIVKFALSFPVRYMELFVFHNTTGSQLSPIVGEISRAIGDELTHGKIRSKSEIGKGLEDISQIINSRISDYGIRFENIAAYNAAASDNAQSAIFCVICDYPNGFSAENQKDLLSIMQEGNRCGVYTVLIRNRKIPALGSEYGKKSEILDLIGNTLIIKAENDSFYINGLKYTFNLGGDAELTDLLDSLKDSKKQKSDPIPLRSLQLPKRNGSNDFSENLVIPVGKTGSQVQCIEMSSDGNKAHLLVAGMTGSGKSVFLHTFILSASNVYSPAELEFYLIDLKDGVEFNLYRDVLKIPHVKMLAVNEGDIKITYEMLKALSGEMARRNEIFKRLETRNIVEYNKRVLSGDYDKKKFGELKPMPRAVIIIDEYQDIFRDSSRYGGLCIEELIAMARKGRSPGMGLLLSSQTVPTSGFGDIKEQIANIVLFNAKEETIEKLLPGKSRYRNELSREKGMAFYANDEGQEPILFRAAYPGDRTDAGENGLYANAERINEKYKNYAADMIIAGENDELRMMQSRLGFVTGDMIPLPRTEDSAEIVFGQSGSTGYQKTVKFQSSKAVLPIIGDSLRSKNIEMTLLLSTMYERKLNNTNDEIIYLDCDPVRKQNIISAFATCKGFIYACGIDDCKNVTERLKKEAKKRAADGFDNNIFIFIHGTAALSTAPVMPAAPAQTSKLEQLMQQASGAVQSDADNALNDLMAKASHAGIYLIIQVDNEKDYRTVFGKNASSAHMLFVSGADAKSAIDAYMNIPIGKDDKNEISREDVGVMYCAGESLEKARKIIYKDEDIDYLRKNERRFV